MFVSSSVTAFALFAAIASMPVPASTGVKAVPQASVQSVSASGQFATLRGVTAVPMASRELDAVKGAHFHFATPSQKLNFFPARRSPVRTITSFLAPPTLAAMCAGKSAM
jgi:hypothetical protein